jgi:lysophospholipase L1-like esterase
MKRIKYFFTIKFAFVLLLCIGGLVSNAQPFKNEIDAFKKADSVAMPANGSILFVGSSSFNYWKDIKNYFPGYPILNRGFGGSTLNDLIFYANETIIKYHPKQIYIYCGENDIADKDKASPEITFDRFKTLFTIIRTKLPTKIPIVFVSIKPSISRWSLEDKFVAANKLIKTFLAKQPNTQYLDTHSAMLDSNGILLQDIFIKDNLHMNAKGYVIWQKIIAPTLLP